LLFFTEYLVWVLCDKVRLVKIMAADTEDFILFGGRPNGRDADVRPRGAHVGSRGSGPPPFFAPSPRPGATVKSIRAIDRSISS